MTTKGKICPTELDMSEINNNKTQDMSDRDIIMLDKICPTATKVMLDKIYARQRDNYVGQDMPDKNSNTKHVP